MKSWPLKFLQPLLALMVFSLSAAPLALGSDYNSTELTNRIQSGAYLQKTDNVMIMIDGLGHQRQTKMKIAKELMVGIGDTIPNVPHTRLIRMFGPDAEDFESEYSSIFGMYHTQGANFKNYTPVIATKTYETSTIDPLGLSFINAASDLSKLQGSHALILISDGKSIEQGSLNESVYLKKKFGGSICFYPIFIGNDAYNESRMEKIAHIGGCGLATAATTLANGSAMTDFVEQVMFAKRRVPLRPVSPVVEQVMVPDAIDEIIIEDSLAGETAVEESPYVPELIGETAEDEMIILERQLPHDKVITIELHVEFDLNKATVKPEYDEQIKEVADFMTTYPETEALLVGHTCDLGSEEYNLELSKKRADAVRNYLTNKLAIDPSRLKTHGAGELEPIADNSTEEGRMKNRRVMAVISTIITDVIIIEQEILKSDFMRDDFVLPAIEFKEEILPQEQLFEPENIEESVPNTTENELPAPALSMTEPVETAEHPAAEIVGNETEFVPESSPQGMEPESSSPQEPQVEEAMEEQLQIAEEDAVGVEAPPVEEQEETPATTEDTSSSDVTLPASKDEVIDQQFKNEPVAAPPEVQPSVPLKVEEAEPVFSEQPEDTTVPSLPNWK